MAWKKNDPSLGNDPTYLEPRITELEGSKVDKSEKGVSVATLGIDGKVPLEQLPEIETGGVKSVNSNLPDEEGDVLIPVFSGSYTALTDKPTIPSTPAGVGLNNVDNVKQMPIAGGTFTGISKAHPNTSYTVAQLRNVILSTGDAVGGSNGDIWIKYT